MWIRIACCVAWSVAVSLESRGQELLQRLTGKTSEHLLGSAVAFIDDIDGDGIEDFAAGAPRREQRRPGLVRLYSGPTVQMLEDLVGEDGDRFGAALLKVGDVDGDGAIDFAVGAPGRRHLGAADGSVFLYSGADRSLIRELKAGTAGDSFGLSLALIDDLDLDGTADIIVGAPESSHGSAVQSGAVCVVSMGSGATLLVLTGLQGEHLGQSVCGLGDVDGDGIADFAAGAPDSNGHAGRVVVLSGKDGGVIDQLVGSNDDYFGIPLANAGDLDGDQVCELMIGADEHFPYCDDRGYVKVVHFPGATVVHHWIGGFEGATFGRSVAATSDFDGDGVQDLVVAAPAQLRARPEISVTFGAEVCVRFVLDD